MARASRNKPTSTGPGSGSPRSRTAARPGERAAGNRTRTRAVDPPPELDNETEVGPHTRGAANRALGITWRLLILGAVVAAVAVTLAQSLRVYFAQAEEIATLRMEIQDRHDEIAGLADQLERWNDPRFVEAEARERLGWVMPGEVGYRVIDANGEPIGGETDVFTREESVPAGPWWDQMWGSVQVADAPVPVEDPDTQPQPGDDVTIGASPEPSPSHTE